MRANAQFGSDIVGDKADIGGDIGAADPSSLVTVGGVSKGCVGCGAHCFERDC